MALPYGQGQALRIDGLIEQFNTIVYSHVSVIKVPAALPGPAPAPAPPTPFTPHLLGFQLDANNTPMQTVPATVTPEPHPSNPSVLGFPSSGVQSMTSVFFLLHRAAVRLTRIRYAHCFRRSDVIGAAAMTTDYSAANLAGAIANTGFAMDRVIDFPMPAFPNVGVGANAAAMNLFLGALRVAIVAIQSNPNYGEEVVACHTSCHGSCHGARGRR